MADTGTGVDGQGKGIEGGPQVPGQGQGPERRDVSIEGISEDVGQEVMSAIEGTEKFPTGKLETQLPIILKSTLTQERAKKFMERAFKEYGGEVGSLEKADLADLLRIAIISKEKEHIKGVLSNAKFKIPNETVDTIANFLIKGEPYETRLKELLLPQNQSQKSSIFEGNDFFITIRILDKVTKFDTKFWRKAKENVSPELFSKVVEQFVKNPTLGQRFLLFMEKKHWQNLNEYYKKVENKKALVDFDRFFRNLMKEKTFESVYRDPKKFEAEIERMATMT